MAKFRLKNMFRSAGSFVKGLPKKASELNPEYTIALIILAVAVVIFILTSSR